ncbi:damage-control phosphatase ARMT1 [Drosophila ficusphila]|uniref:damage-control phosphatase ARMT1 n=1 Tax=Drosophila ficusphila TaxID=30025 RepID=UPI0007E84D1D|nr:damage-control phosphatase ARMT1 [Drosophila ficusphila]
MAFQFKLNKMGWRISTQSDRSLDSVMDGPTPRHSLLSGRYKQSFAYLTLRTRMPGIMQQIIMRVMSDAPDLVEKYGEEVRKDISHIVDAVERLKLELNRDRQFLLFHGAEPDKAEWNAFITELPRPKRTFFRACWLHSECYLYRRISSFFENSHFLQNYDCFATLKQEDLMISEVSMRVLARATRGLARSFDIFKKLLRIVLWGNHFDMQFSGFEFSEEDNKDDIGVLAQVADIDRILLVDDSVLLWNCLMKEKKDGIVDYICDNGGFEFFTDMLLLEYLIDNNLANQVRLHVKAIPWYISDVTHADVEWTIDFLKKHKDECLSSVGKKWDRLFSSRKIVVAPPSYFWTGPQPYFVMVESNLELYREFTISKLAIFKGDLNYRKLLGDYIWDSAEEFITCLRGFRPTNMCALRTVKCEVVCGLPEGMADALLRSDQNWMISGKYGLIQYTDSLKCCCALPGQVSNTDTAQLVVATQSDRSNQIAANK